MRVDINNASEAELMILPGIGAAKAKKIIEYRNYEGKFTHKDELQYVEGIGEGVYRQLKQDVYCGSLVSPGQMSRETFRRRHQAEIEDAAAQGHKLDVCHIISKANGGVDHKDNFILAGASFNRRIQHRHDELMCALAGEQQTRKAIRACRIVGDLEMQVDEAKSLVSEGKKGFRKYHQQYGHGMDVWDGKMEGASEEEDLDPSQIRDTAYCEWVIQIWNKGSAGHDDTSD